MYLYDDETFQDRVKQWIIQCFGIEDANNKLKRNYKFLEEALELVQSTGLSREEAHGLVDYVFNRPIGEPYQEVGGVMITLATLCNANDLNMHQNGETELKRIWNKIDDVREKEKTKPIKLSI